MPTPLRSLGLRVFATAIFPFLAACASSIPDGQEDFEQLCEWMQGSYSSAAQSRALPTSFFDIRLEMSRIWPERTDGCWLYVEQASARSLDKPYRQRVYHLKSSGYARATSAVYTLPGRALDWAGAWRDPSRFEAIEPEDLELREGCTIFLEKQADSWVGGTRGRGCASSLRGAAYATSIVRVLENSLESWDRGFDKSGEQVWGATAGAYIFERTKAKPDGN